MKSLFETRSNKFENLSDSDKIRFQSAIAKMFGIEYPIRAEDVMTFTKYLTIGMWSDSKLTAKQDTVMIKVFSGNFTQSKTEEA